MSASTVVEDAEDALQDAITPQATPEPAGQQDPAQAPQDGADEAEQDDKEPRSQEARKYRQRLRAAEAERDAALDQLDLARRGLAEHLAQSTGMKPAAMWAAGATVQDLLDEAGNVDPAMVKAACDRAVDLLGVTRTPRPDPLQGVGDSVPTPVSFASAFTPHHKPR